ncbi:MAG: 23S rRNA (pseudouridine(1915)-N(3))-methyltransferase RlmH [Lachnospiraceae bacterium]|nr:23S rRNA (pseudouridine(1915)-N(3))-methyltransferase RlmH [Lachnospiraceae bacterium]
MKITILCVGKIKEKFYTEAIDEYSKRLSRYCKLDIIQVADEKTPENASPAVERQIKDKEGERLMKYLANSNAHKIVLAIEGKMMDSVELSQYFHRQMVTGCSELIFVIGGSLGLSEEVLSCADLKLSFSKMTFPHQLMRVILLEQIYRGYRIMNHEPYHK